MYCETDTLAMETTQTTQRLKSGLGSSAARPPGTWLMESAADQVSSSIDCSPELRVVSLIKCLPEELSGGAHARGPVRAESILRLLHER
jgi:hypothetical protein